MGSSISEFFLTVHIIITITSVIQGETVFYSVPKHFNYFEFKPKPEIKTVEAVAQDQEMPEITPIDHSINLSSLCDINPIEEKQGRRDTNLT